MTDSLPSERTQNKKQLSEYVTSDEEIERARLLVGVETTSATRHYVTTATEDAIHNFALACGNDNPLHCDSQYAAQTQWRSIIAPTIMAGLMNKPLLGDQLDPGLKARTAGLFQDCHAFVSGGDWTFYRPIRPGDRIYTYEAVESVEPKISRFGGRSVHMIRRRVKFNERAEPVAVCKIRRIISPRRNDKSPPITTQPASYTEPDIARIDAVYCAEQVRGNDTRWFEDVAVGDSLGVMAKGPLTITDVLTFHAGGGFGFTSRIPVVGRLGVKDRWENPSFYGKNQFGAYDVLQRVHWDPWLAEKLGHPAPYDYGVMRESYLYHYLSDWCGDDGWVVRLYDELRKFNYLGDTQLINGEVVGTRQEEGLGLVDVKVTMRNQRDEECVRCKATIALPSRGAGMAVLPHIPEDLTARTERLWMRHQELLQQKTAPHVRA